MYDQDEQHVFAMMLRIDLPSDQFESLSDAMRQIGGLKDLSIRVWSAERRERRPRLAICATHRQETPRALLQAIQTDHIRAEAAVMIGNRPDCEGLAAEYNVPWHMIGDDDGVPDDARLVEICDAHEVDYIVLARYMRILPPDTCWQYAGGRIINLHHGLLPSFPGPRPYHDAYTSRMLTYGATCHFIVPELDAGNQIIQQSTFTIAPGTRLPEILRRGQCENEPVCLVEGVRRVVDREVELHFHRVVARR
jgi:formyltetrahydrofolate deformylase